MGLGGGAGRSGGRGNCGWGVFIEKKKEISVKCMDFRYIYIQQQFWKTENKR